MPAPADDNKDTISVLNTLIETCEDGQKGYSTAAEAVKDVRYKDLLQRNAEQRGRFASELQSEVLRLGGKPKDSGTAAGAMHRGWIELRTAITSKDEKAVLAECERGEDHAVKSYRDALAKPLAELAEPARSAVTRQATEVQRGHDSMRRLRDAEKATEQH